MRILVTGGTGSWGKALIAYYLTHTGHRVVCYSRCELKQAELKEQFPDDRLDCFLGDVRDLPRLHLAFEADIDIVIHCAALKRVDALSYNPEESLKTNVIGSMNVLTAARGKVKKCLLISSDKAVQAQNVYGASKMMAEQLFVASNASSIPKGTASAVVRSGNALGSRGSVVGVWRSQKAASIPLTVTHREMTRFLLTLPQAVAFIETALAEMEGGEIYVPRLKAARMIDLAEAIAGDAPGAIARPSGLRPGGEKLHETLMTEEEASRATFHPLYGVIRPDLTPWRVASPCRLVGPPPLMEPWRSDTAPRLHLEELKLLLRGL